jgi:dihydrofolate reductase
VKRKTILYIATSLDGFIARKDGSVDWLDKFMSPKEDYGYKEFLDSITTVLMGNSTYKQILSFGEFPYKTKKCYVFSRKANSDDNVTFVKCDVKEFLDKLKSDKNVWLVGGANLINQFLQDNLIDEFIITIIPTFLGSGIPLFIENNIESQLKLLKMKSYDSGVVQLHYKMS